MRKEVCARCGHESAGCPHCDMNDPFLGGQIGKYTYCHTFSWLHGPTCYTRATWEQVITSMDEDG